MNFDKRVFFIFLVLTLSILNIRGYEVNSSSLILNNINSLSVNIDNTTGSVLEDSFYLIQITVTTDNLTDVSLTFTITDGEVGTGTDIIQDLNGTIQYILNMTTPVVISDTVITLSVTASAESITASDTLSLTVKPVYKEFDAVISLTSSDIYQNESLSISVLVSEKGTITPVVGASVAFLLELGYFEGDAAKSGSLSLNTNSTGMVTANIIFGEEDFLFAEQDLNISLSIEKEKFDTLSLYKMVKVKRVALTGSYMVTSTTTTIEEKGEVSFTIVATLGNNPWIGVTIQGSATGGQFENGELVFRTKTSDNGTVTIIWDVKNFPKLVEAQKITVTIELIHAEHDLDAYIFEITVNPVNESPIITSTLDTNNIPLSYSFLLLFILPIWRKRS